MFIILSRPAVVTAIMVPAAMPCVPLHSTVINLKSRWYPELLGLLLAYDAWVRSGFSEESYGCLSIAASGSRNYAYATRYFAVRPALHLFAENLLQTIPEFRSYKYDGTDKLWDEGSDSPACAA